MRNCTTSLSLACASKTPNKVWKAPVLQVVHAAEAQSTTLTNTVDGVIPVGTNGNSTLTFGS